jgi:hypothetical protein
MTGKLSAASEVWTLLNSTGSCGKTKTEGIIRFQRSLQ